MKVLVVGSGGREHAICRALATGARPAQILAAPGNPGIASTATTLPIAVNDVDALVAAAVAEEVDYVIPGPELPLVRGLADALAAAGIPCCGPLAGAARLEGSKAFTRAVCRAAGVPSPRFRVVDSASDLDAALAGFDSPPVVKADGLAGGKGVFLPDDLDGCRAAAVALLEGSMGDAGRRVVVEERLEGSEASLFFLVAGTTAVPLPHARDHKRLLDGDEGPNTGGMGAVSPNPDLDEATISTVTDGIVRPVLEHMAAASHPFGGFFYAGVMLTADGPKLLEINVRLGDPEAQVILPRLAPGAFAEIAGAAARGRLDSSAVGTVPDATCGVVLAAEGYPDAPVTGDPITIRPGAEGPDVWIDHAATSAGDGGLVTAGGRVAAVVARKPSAVEARAAAYEAAGAVRWRGMQYRSDIGAS